MAEGHWFFTDYCFLSTALTLSVPCRPMGFYPAPEQVDAVKNIQKKWGSTLPNLVAIHVCLGMCECAMPQVLRASCRSGVLTIPKSACLISLEGCLIDATGYAPGLPSPMRPISVLAQNPGGMSSVLIQVLFCLPT